MRYARSSRCFSSHLRPVIFTCLIHLNNYSRRAPAWRSWSTASALNKPSSSSSSSSSSSWEALRHCHGPGRHSASVSSSSSSSCNCAAPFQLCAWLPVGDPECTLNTRTHTRTAANALARFTIPAALRVRESRADRAPRALFAVPTPDSAQEPPLSLQKYLKNADCVTARALGIAYTPRLTKKPHAPGWAEGPGGSPTHPLPLLRVPIISSAERRPGRDTVS